MHYAFDLWMARTHPDLPWCRYADDGLVHCRTEQEAQALKVELQARLAECRLEMHPTKTKIVYCKDGKRRGKYPNVEVRLPRVLLSAATGERSRNGRLFCGFNPAVSASALKAMRATIRDLNLRHQTQLSLEDIARQINPLLRGWIEYYGRYAPSALYPLLRYVNQTLLAWVTRKFKRFKGHKVRASQFLQRLAQELCGPFRTLADRYDRHVCLMGADEARGSRSVLREAGGEIPPAYSPVSRQNRSAASCSLKPRIHRMRPLIPRWSCSSRLFR